jgi:hypothetical protein
VRSSLLICYNDHGACRHLQGDERDGGTRASGSHCGRGRPRTIVFHAKSGGKTLPSETRTRKTPCISTFNFVIARAPQGPAAIQTAFPPALPLRKTDPPHGLPRRFAPRNDEAGGECTGFPPHLIATLPGNPLAQPWALAMIGSEGYRRSPGRMFLAASSRQTSRFGF